MRWVKLTLPSPVRSRKPLITLRLTSSSLAGTLRKLVAVGTVEAALHVGGDGRAGAPDRLAGFGSPRLALRRATGVAVVVGAGAGSASATGAGAGGAEPWSAAISRMRGDAAAAAASAGVCER